MHTHLSHYMELPSLTELFTDKPQNIVRGRVPVVLAPYMSASTKLVLSRLAKSGH